MAYKYNHKRARRLESTYSVGKRVPDSLKETLNKFLEFDPKSSHKYVIQCINHGYDAYEDEYGLYGYGGWRGYY